MLASPTVNAVAMSCDELRQFTARNVFFKRDPLGIRAGQLPEALEINGGIALPADLADDMQVDRLSTRTYLRQNRNDIFIVLLARDRAYANKSVLALVPGDRREIAGNGRIQYHRTMVED